MNNIDSVRQFGRLRYVEPTNISHNREGNYSDMINFPYEEYNMAIDLTIRQTNRYSCGWWDKDGSMKEMNFSSKNGTISFLGGTRGYSSLSNEDDSYLTTNFTDISMTNPETNTSECLGIESINITYNSWMYPQVVIKFVDVRGATVMLPAEKGYYNHNDVGNASAIYKSLFSFPYPMFILKVKGFYGKGVTYKLAVHKTQFEYDANTGNFNITVDFIGYMYGIYSDIPITFLAAAPYMKRGREYWKQKISSGEFLFMDENGKNGKPMLTIPELRLRLAQASQNEFAVSAAAEGEQIANALDQRYQEIINLNDSFPFQDWFLSDDIPYMYKVFKTKNEAEEFVTSISNYVARLTSYDNAYQTNFLEGIKSLKNFIDVLQKECEGDVTEMVKYFGLIHYLSNGRDSYVFDSKFETDSIKIEPYEDVKEYINKERGGLTDFYVMALSVFEDFIGHEKFAEKIKGETDSIYKEKEKQIEYYRSKENGIIEKVLGFRPSIKNIYDLMFAHMDTFIHCFYDSTKIIKDQLEREKEKRAKKTFDIRDNDTDTENVKIKTSNGSEVINQNTRCEYLPPYAAFYKKSFIGANEEKKDTIGGESAYVLRWPGELRKGETLEEVHFIDELLSATEMYFEETEDVSKSIELLNSSGESKTNATFSNGTPSFNISNFIPITAFDFVNKDKIGNPYKYITDKVYNGDKSFESELITTFILRAYYYLATDYDGFTIINDDAISFGRLEAINVFKAIKDKYSDAFLNFINKNDWIDKVLYNSALNSTDDSELLKIWENNAPNLNNVLFSIINNNFIYNFHKGFSFKKTEIDDKNYVISSLGSDGKPTKDSYKALPDKNYVMFPLYFEDFNSLEKYYTSDKDMLKNPNMIPINYDDVIYGGDQSSVSTFYLYNDARDYIKNLYITLEDEINKAKEDISKINSNFSNRDESAYGNIGRAGAILRGYKNDLNATFSENTYVFDTIVDKEETRIEDKELSQLIDGATYNQLKDMWIKFPSIDISIEGEQNSIFSHPLYQRQKNILAKAYLFIQSIPIIGENYGIDLENKNGVSLKTKLLREGAYYWYMDNSNMVDFSEIRIKDKDDNIKTYNFKKPKENQTINVQSTSRILLESDKKNEYTEWKYPKGMTASRKRVLKQNFIEWATSTDINGFAANEERLTNKNLYSRPIKKEKYKELGKVDNSKISNKDVIFIKEKIYNGASENEYFDNNETRDYKYGLDIAFLASEKNSTDGIEAKKLQDFLRDLFFGLCTTFDYYNGITDNEINGQNGVMYTIKRQLKKAIKSFMTGLKEIYGKTATELKENSTEFYRKMSESKVKNPFNNTDLKLSTYMTVKNLYDKWLCSPYNGPEETWALTRKENSLSDFDNFKYADSFYNDIGYKLLANVSKVSSWLSSCMPSSNMNTTEGIMGYTGRTLYEFLAEVAQDSGGMLMALPQKFGLATTEDVNEMFTPISIRNNWDEDSSTFIFMYTYKPSEHLGDENTGNIDMNGWSPNGDGLDLTDDEIVGRVLGNSDSGYIVPAFGVTYGKQNQSIFKNVQLSTVSQGVTEAGISATMNIASKCSESPRESTLYGQDLYRVYSNYSYQCNVETMGNTQILPMMYFQLNNIPFWKGAYMIKKVTHSISAGNMNTTFEGIRINRYAIPMSDGAVIIDKKIGNEQQDSNIIAGGDNHPTTGPNGRVKKLHDTIGNLDIKLDFEPTFDESNITNQKPIIYIFPAHSINNKNGKIPEYLWSSKVVDKIIQIFKNEEYQFYDGTSYMRNVQRGLKTGSKYYGQYTGSEAFELVKRYGSKKVITLVVHWNGGSANASHFLAMTGGKDDIVRPDTIKFGECLVEEANITANNSSTFLKMPKGFMDNTNKYSRVQEFYPITKNGETSYKSTDCGTMPNCACGLSENWFASYGDKNLGNWDSCVDTDENGRYLFGKAWLEDEEGINAIAQLNARAIKRYIDTLTDILPRLKSWGS